MVVGSAIESVLSQSFDDFEIVVCDNASDDNTEEMVRKIDDPRVRFIRSDEWIQKEKFFEFSLTHAEGEYSVLFFDDDIMCRDALQKAYDSIDEETTDILVFARNGVYFYQSWFDPAWKNTLQIPKYSGHVYEYDSADSLKAFYQERELRLETPMVTNAFFRTSFINDLIKKYGSLFLHGHMGDYNVAVFTLLHSKTFRFLNDPIVIFGHWKENTTQQLHFLQSSMPEYQEWIAEIKENMLTKMPFKEYLWSNCIWASLQDMKERLDIPYSLDWNSYLQDIRSELSVIESKGVDVGTLKVTLDDVTNDFDPTSMQVPEEAGITQISIAPLDIVKKGVRTNGVIFPEIAKGEMLGFDDILGATRFFESFNGELLGQGETALSEESKRARLYCTDIKQNREAGLRYFVNRLHEIEAANYQKVTLVAANTIAKLALRFLGDKVVALVDSNTSLVGKEFDNTISVAQLDTLAELDTDLVLVTKPNANELVEAVERINDNREGQFDIIVVE